MSHPIYRIRSFEIVGPYTLTVRFDDDTEQSIDFRPFLAGELYGALRDVEVTVKDGRGNIFFRDSRKGANESGKSNQDFAVNLPRETPGPLIFEFKLYEAETGTLFDSGEREIALTGTGGGISDSR